MSRHVTYRGVTLDMDSMRRENEKVTAIGNMSVNAKGDRIKGGLVTKTADQIARENHRVRSTITKSGLKGPQPVSPAANLDAPKPAPKVKDPVKTKEVELPSGDIVIEEETSESKSAKK